MCTTRCCLLVLLHTGAGAPLGGALHHHRLSAGVRGHCRCGCATTACPLQNCCYQACQQGGGRRSRRACGDGAGVQAQEGAVPEHAERPLAQSYQHAAQGHVHTCLLRHNTRVPVLMSCMPQAGCCWSAGRCGTAHRPAAPRPAAHHLAAAHAAAWAGWRARWAPGRTLMRLRCTSAW